MNGMVIARWNPKTGNVKEYCDLPSDFKSFKPFKGSVCNERPYGNIAFSRTRGKENIVISPFWGNMYLSLDGTKGKMEKWDLPIPITNIAENEYFKERSRSGFLISRPQRGQADCRIWDEPRRKLFDINIDTKEYKEVLIDFDYGDLKKHEPGFTEGLGGMQYCLMENSLNSLKNLLDGDIVGNLFDKLTQLKAFAKINADTDGTCGRNVYEFVKGNI